MDIGLKLLKLIDNVTRSPNKRYAQKEMLTNLLDIFDLDQAAICIPEKQEIRVEFAIDRTRRIIPGGEGLWISNSIITEALDKMMPKAFQEELDDNSLYTKSIHEYSLKNILCIPIEGPSKNAIYLASQKRPNSKFSQQELKNAMIASKASSLALEQFNNIQDLKKINSSLKKSLTTSATGFLYSSIEIQKLMQEVEKIAPFNISTFIHGESGTGKEELAKEIHKQSKRKGPFVAINCATLTETLLESELFGYVKGAFTGAIKDKKGLFLEAHEGTLFLDEIAEIPVNLQSKLLRAIQERSIRPLGSNKSISIDIRIISASLKNIGHCVEAGEFREDLYYRIYEIAFTILPLRERVEDIELLAKKFISDFCKEFDLKKKQLSDECLAHLKKYSFPGNVRELKNICRSAVILSSGEKIGPNDIRLPKESVAPSNILTIQDLRKQKDSEHKNNLKIPSKKYEGMIENIVFEGKTLKDIRKDYDKLLVNMLIHKKNMTQEAVANKLGVSVRTIQRLIQ